MRLAHSALSRRARESGTRLRGAIDPRSQYCSELIQLNPKRACQGSESSASRRGARQHRASRERAFMRCCSPTAVLDCNDLEPRVSTGLDSLDAVLGGLYWGDNVVWQFDGTPVEPFYRAVASQGRVFDTKIVIAVGDAVNTYGVPGLTVLDAAPG